jgi:hypothetical protein
LVAVEPQEKEFSHGSSSAAKMPSSAFSTNSGAVPKKFSTTEHVADIQPGPFQALHDLIVDNWVLHLPDISVPRSYSA